MGFHTIPLRDMSTTGNCLKNQFREVNDPQGRIGSRGHVAHLEDAAGTGGGGDGGSPAPPGGGGSVRAATSRIWRMQPEQAVAITAVPPSAATETLFCPIRAEVG